MASTPDNKTSERRVPVTVRRVEWTPDLAVGVEAIDEQHKELFDRIDRVLRAMADGRAQVDIARLIGFLETYVVLHFGMEEKLMVRLGYPGSNAHQIEHERFLLDFEAIKSLFDTAGATGVVASAISSRVCDWLVHHVSTLDRAFGRFLRTKQVDRPRSIDSRDDSGSTDAVPLLVWTEDLAVGVELIDAQHRELFRRVNKLLLAARKGLGRAELASTLDFLGEYVIEHFDAEERVMRSASYPDYPTHRAEHDGFKRELARLREELGASGATVSLVIGANRTICSWLTGHVRRSDKALGQYLTSRSGTGRA